MSKRLVPGIAVAGDEAFTWGRSYSTIRMRSTHTAGPTRRASGSLPAANLSGLGTEDLYTILDLGEDDGLSLAWAPRTEIFKALLPLSTRPERYALLAERRNDVLDDVDASLPMLMAKSRHKKPENVRRYFHSSAEAIAEVTSLLAPGDSRR
ncbi:hypothetical protein OG864_02645 [Streptomyces sp. NBC_00124]|nr:hypothetical protein [Streptomyces sp. NBC_00140]MCX5357638.1 hypothetical protein [Streptomyces sp. NBC_00124]